MKQKLNAKDFILIGVLTALMWIICMIISTIMSVAGPVTNVFYPSVVAIPNGIVMMLLLAKVPKKGVFTIHADGTRDNAPKGKRHTPRDARRAKRVMRKELEEAIEGKVDHDSDSKE